jgi:Family of unknown function (DUF6953)
MTAGASPEEVAAWMLEELRRQGVLYQEEAVAEVERRFGPAFAYINAHGNPAISRTVLGALRKLSGDDVVWVRSERCWRPREAWNLPGREQP